MTEREKKICKKYGARDEHGFVHCNKCPLVVDVDEHLCKANAQYNRHTKQWELKR